MTGEGSRFIIYNQPESVRAEHALNVSNFLKEKENENITVDSYLYRYDCITQCGSFGGRVART